ncbi:hypothetical protein [Thauera sp.]|uniref:hypothetical protein n=1 Tax=Thauera sp. TaxID=1905334 RepID=UPI001B5E227C|nr:hypothetical protein [Thauera sp.]MBP6130891.1 hypothetical protein [Thauera sp.]MBP7046904.1 hypothetical protein [Thauera sp.]
MTTTNENARTVGGPIRALSSNVSRIHAETLPHTATWGVSSDGLIFPRPWTCAGQLLGQLLVEKGVSHRSFDGLARSMRGAVYVRRLRAAGWPIDTELVAGSNRFENVRYGIYRLGDITIGTAEEEFVIACGLAAEGVLP